MICCHQLDEVGLDIRDVREDVTYEDMRTCRHELCEDVNFVKTGGHVDMNFVSMWGRDIWT